MAAFFLTNRKMGSSAFPVWVACPTNSSTSLTLAWRWPWPIPWILLNGSVWTNGFAELSRAKQFWANSPIPLPPPIMRPTLALSTVTKRLRLLPPYQGAVRRAPNHAFGFFESVQRLVTRFRLVQAVFRFRRLSCPSCRRAKGAIDGVLNNINQ